MFMSTLDKATLALWLSRVPLDVMRQLPRQLTGRGGRGASPGMKDSRANRLRASWSEAGWSSKVVGSEAGWPTRQVRVALQAN